MEIYVHIPFCVKKCAYCDFFSLPGTEKEIQEKYFRDLKEEISESAFSGSRVTSVFFGGGTPSFTDPAYITEVMDLLKKRFRITEDAEITLEANPGTLTDENLKVYRKAGFNRLSLGLQSADDEYLKRLGRIHTYSDFEESFYKARKAGFSNISADLISGIPGETKEGFINSLNKVLDLNPEHISVYSLIIEENTPFYELYGPDGKITEDLPSEEEDRKQVELTRKILKDRGYLHYEISNYARCGFESRHNTGYWTQEEYIGFGAAAASFYYTENGAVRRKNAESLHYRKLPFEEEEILKKEDLMAEFMILGLRRMEGVRDELFRERYGVSFFEVFGETLNKYVSYGVLKMEEDSVFLTERGEDVCNLLFEELI